MVKVSTQPASYGNTPELKQKAVNKEPQNLSTNTTEDPTDLKYSTHAKEANETN